MRQPGLVTPLRGLPEEHRHQTREHIKGAIYHLRRFLPHLREGNCREALASLKLAIEDYGAIRAVSRWQSKLDMKQIRMISRIGGRIGKAQARLEKYCLPPARTRRMPAARRPPI